MTEIGEAIQNELEGMSEDQLRQELSKLVARQEKQRERTKSPEAKARRTAYYEKVRGTDKWKEQRSISASKRKEKQDRLVAMAKAKFSAEELAEIGLKA